MGIRVSLVFLQRAYKEFLILRTDREISYDDSNFSRWLSLIIELNKLQINDSANSNTDKMCADKDSRGY